MGKEVSAKATASRIAQFRKMLFGGLEEDALRLNFGEERYGQVIETLE